MKNEFRALMLLVCGLWVAFGCKADMGQMRTGGGAQFQAAASRIQAVPSDSLAALIGTLKHVPGRFEQGVNGVMVFKGDRNIFRAIREFEDNAVVRLVACLDDTMQAAATSNGRNVLTGVMCDQALKATAYYEAVDERGDADPTWPGYISPDATATQLRAAKKAWEVVVRKRAYVIP